MISNSSLNRAPIDQLGPAANVGAIGNGPGRLAGPTGPTHFASLSETAKFELIRDVVALANSGGGVLQVVSDGRRDTAAVSSLSAVVIVQQLAQYADSPFADVTVRVPDGASNPLVEIVVGAAEFPIGFRRSAPRVPSNRLAEQQSVFSAGKFYFRRGDESVPGTSADLRTFFERMLTRVRRRWLRGFQRVLSQPIESMVAKRHRSHDATPAVASAANLQPVRIVTDPDAPALQPQHVDRLYPWRQKDLVNELNTRLGRRALTTYDIQAVQRQHQLDERPEFVFHLPGAGRRYSPAVAEWMIGQFGDDPEFFHRARFADQAMLRLRRQKPR